MPPFFTVSETKMTQKTTGSRTQNSARNAAFSMVCYVITLVFNFINRTVFVHMLGVDYLGVNGLFSNILLILSFAELGIGNAIVYNMYKPLAENNVEKLKSLMQLYKRAYVAIGLIVTAIGLAVIPFLSLIIREEPNITDNLVLIYVLFLINTSSSYFFMYKRSIIVADQKLYIAVSYQQIFDVMRVILQLFFLLVTRNYIVYLATFIFFTVANNIALSVKADKLYPFLKEKNAQPLEASEKKSIFKDVKALFMYRIGSVVLDGTDNIIITRIVNLAATGLCSNYTMIISIFSGVLSQFLNSFTASVGNLNATSRDERGPKVFGAMFLSCVWMYGFAAGGLCMFFNEFITLWLGKQFLLPTAAFIALVVNFYIGGIQYVPYTFRTTMGLFRQGKWAPLLAAVINIFLSVYWGTKFGIAGVFFATTAARCLSINLIDPILVYRIGFKKNPVWYFVKFFASLALVVVLSLVSYKVVSLIALAGWVGFFVRVLLYSLIFNVLMLAALFRTPSFRELYDRFGAKLMLKRKAG